MDKCSKWINSSKLHEFNYVESIYFTVGQLHYKVELVLQSEISIMMKQGNFASLLSKRRSITNWRQIIYYRMAQSLLQSGKELFHKLGQIL